MASDVEKHQRFLASLARSEVAVRVAAQWFRRRGYDVTLPPMTRAAVRADWWKHSDNGDLFIQKPGGPRERVEVKWLQYAFTCRADWPHRDRFIVMQARNWNRADPKPFVHVFLSPDLQFIAIVHGHTSGQWYLDDVEDHRYQESQTNYLCPIELVEFKGFNEP